MLVHTFHTINQQDRIQKAFELCHSGNFNLSHPSLSSRPLCQVLDELHQTIPDLARAIMAPRKRPCDISGIHPCSGPVIHEGFTDTPEDDADVTVEEVFESVAGHVPDGVEVNGGLQTARTCAEEAESDTLDGTTVVPPTSNLQSCDLGRGM
ncbi:uncharacterized protein EI90DRAFT_3115129 [Cantharellus anzutake]|uniref:uncharacterized protein n=1 Tax=Cantharellus anzutake TaxID=1750568 RepID=UPI0019077013|nr:uncharacterized protein EI90DRAFT_3115129 [Cantharellus anzutake]KAF8344353.1 hypothetical protein EI90DRAFT_3115129 [Cantharellus anzutake]